MAARVRQARLDANLTQVELAERANVTPLTLHKLEAGRNVNLETFLRVLFALGRLDDFLQVLQPREVRTLEELRLREASREEAATRRRRVHK